MRHYRPLRRQQFLAARGLLRRQLETATGISGSAWRITSDAKGRPVATTAAGTAGPDVSLSHSGDRVAAAVTNSGRIGVDIERAVEGRASNDLAEASLSPAERAIVARDGQMAFLRFWTLREAIGKAIGDGFSAALGVPGETLLPVGATPALVTVNGSICALGCRVYDWGALAVAWMPDPAMAGNAIDLLTVALRDMER